MVELLFSNQSGEPTSNTPTLPTTSGSEISETKEISFEVMSTLATASECPTIQPAEFEGPEKLLEIWFKPNPAHPLGLRKIEESKLKEMLRLVKCEIISKSSSASIDAYLLRFLYSSRFTIRSESSMFIESNKFILKTCGTTTLLNCIDRLFELAREQQLHEIEFVFYSRKSFMFPHIQTYPHTNWTDETDFLSRHFKNGSAYVVGKTNGDHWYCYVWEHGETTLIPDRTLEILMSGIDQDVLSCFYSPPLPSSTIRDPTQALHKIMPGSEIDDFFFSPCGYSCNGLLQKNGYFTVHVTPEPHCSYASFETNKITHSDSIIEEVVALFQPEKFTVTLFKEASKSSDGNPLFVGGNVHGYRRECSIMYELGCCDLDYFHYTKVRE